MESLLALLSHSYLLTELVEFLLDLVLPFLLGNVVDADFHRRLDIRPSVLHLVHDVIELLL